VPEILRDGVTGLIVKKEAHFAEALRRVGEISRVNCRREAEQRFNLSSMASGYEAIYQFLINTK